MKRVWLGLLFFAGMTAGCRSPMVAPPVSSELALSPYGEVVYVQEPYQYVILKSPDALGTNSEWSLMREGAPVARVRVAGAHRGGYWVADLLNGHAEVGDWIAP